MASVFLIAPPYLSKHKAPPLGLAYIGSFLKRKGYSVSIIDMDPLGLDYSDIETIIKSGKPDIIGISAMTPQINGALMLAEIVKKLDKSIPVVTGGVHASSLPEQVLSNKYVDFVVIGEGEITFSELIDNLLSSKSSFDKIQGIAFRNGNEVRLTEPRPLMDDLDSLPFPLWKGLPIEKYTEMASHSGKLSGVFPILGTRGCPNRCIFCASGIIFKHVYRCRSAKNIFDEIAFLMDEYGANQFDFVDDTLTINKNGLIELCNMIIDNELDITWGCNGRVNTVDEELLSKIAEAGCVSIDFGVESGDPGILKNLRKRINLDQVKEAHHLAKKAGLTVTSFFMVGHPGEDWQSIERTVELARKLETDFPTCAITTPFPGTELYEIASKNGWIKVSDWDKYIISPYLMQNYEPVMVNGVLSQEEILKAYYYVNAKFAAIKSKTRYGRFYFLKSRFYRNEIIARAKHVGLRNFPKLILQLVRHRTRRND